MTNLRDDRQNNLVSFLRQNQPLPPKADPQLEQRLLDALEPRKDRRRGYFAWTIPSAIATGFLFTSVNFSFRTPRIALEPQDIENFLVKNWHNTLEDSGSTAIEETEAYWLLPAIAEPQPALSVSAQ